MRTSRYRDGGKIRPAELEAYGWEGRHSKHIKGLRKSDPSGAKPLRGDSVSTELGAPLQSLAGLDASNPHSSLWAPCLCVDFRKPRHQAARVGDLDSQPRTGVGFQ